MILRPQRQGLAQAEIDFAEALEPVDECLPVRVGARRLERLIGLVRDLESVDDLREVTALLRP